jgi:mxaK protein
LSLVAAAWFGHVLWQAERWNAAIAAGEGFDAVAWAEPARAGGAAASAPESGSAPVSSSASGGAAVVPVASHVVEAVEAASGTAAVKTANAATAPASVHVPVLGAGAEGAGPLRLGGALAVARPASGAASGAEAPAWLNDGRPLHWRFANARHLAESGDLEGALARYRSLYDDPALGLAARYNSGNALLRGALVAREAGHMAQSLVLLELAKEAYRGVLRLEPTHWDTRYNLERVQRLQPDPTAEDLAGAEPPKAAERAATTMRGTSRGMP